MYIEISRNATVAALAGMWTGFSVEGITSVWHQRELRTAVDARALDYEFPDRELKHRVAECGTSLTLVPPQDAELVFDELVTTPGHFVALEDGAGMVACGLRTVSAEPRIQVWVDSGGGTADRVTMIERLPDESRRRAVRRAVPSRRAPDEEVELDVDNVGYLVCAEQFPITLAGVAEAPSDGGLVGPVETTENAIRFASHGDELAIELIRRKLRKAGTGEVLYADGTLELPHGVLSVFDVGGSPISTVYLHDRLLRYSVTLEEKGDGITARLYMYPQR